LRWRWFEWPQNISANQHLEAVLQNIEAMMLNFIIWKRIRIIIRFVEPINQLWKKKAVTGEEVLSFFVVLSVAEGRDQLERRWVE
jgi:hypothetical protein